MRGEPFSFAFIADSQLGMNSPYGLKGPGSATARLNGAISYVNVMNDNDVDFVVFGGDELQKEEWDYIETELAGAPADCEHRFVVMHWPLFSRCPDEENTYWNMPNRQAMLDLFKEYKVSCILSGHWQQDIDANWVGISLITSVGTATVLQYPEELSFKVVTVLGDGWSVRRVSVVGG